VTRNNLTLPLNVNHLFHTQQLDAAFMFNTAEGFHEVHAVLYSGDVQGVNSFRVDEISDKVPVNVNLF